MVEVYTAGRCVLFSLLVIIVLNKDIYSKAVGIEMAVCIRGDGLGG